MTPDELTGRSRTHIVAVDDPPCALHRAVVTPFSNLRRAAMQAGFDLKVASGFRDFDRQLAIWNRKFTGENPLFDASGEVLDVATMSPDERIAGILRWSALPGASRHHWGTDCDLYDARAIEPGYQVQLSTAEFAANGPFARMSRWLDEHAAHYGFFRPFLGIRSAVQSEPWHFSFAPLAETARRALTCDVLRGALADAPLLGKDQIMAQLRPLHRRYVETIDWP